MIWSVGAEAEHAAVHRLVERDGVGLSCVALEQRVGAIEVVIAEIALEVFCQVVAVIGLVVQRDDALSLLG